jgi:hypothetical protein
MLATKSKKIAKQTNPVHPHPFRREIPENRKKKNPVHPHPLRGEMCDSNEVSVVRESGKSRVQVPLQEGGGGKEYT